LTWLNERFAAAVQPASSPRKGAADAIEYSTRIPCRHFWHRFFAVAFLCRFHSKAKVRSIRTEKIRILGVSLAAVAIAILRLIRPLGVASKLIE
jgi:hypothetical protein